MLRTLAPDVLVQDFPFSMLGIPLGGRSTLLRAPDGASVLISPGPADAAFDAEVAAGGPLVLVAPNGFHHLFLEDAKKRHPSAKVVAADLARKKLGTPAFETLSPTALPSGLLVLPIEGAPAVDESWIFHEASGTLVITDFAFHLRGEYNAFVRMFLRWNQSLGTFGPTKHGLGQVKDRKAFRRSVDRALELPIGRIVVSHGDVVETDGRDVLRAGFARVT